MKKIIMHIGFMIIVFFAAFFVINFFSSKEKSQPIVEMPQASLPVLGIITNDTIINRMYGYEGNIDASLIHDTITPVGSDSKIQITVMKDQHDITAVAYEVLYGSSQEKVEEGVVNQLKKKKKFGKTGTITLQNSLKAEEEYLLKLTIRLTGKNQVSYYTRIKYAQEDHYEECLTFAQEIQKMALEKNEALAAYLETDNDLISNNLADLSIHSSYAAISYGTVTPKQIGGTKISVKEINKDYTTIELKSILKMKNTKDQEHTTAVVERMKIRYGTTRMYLLDYTRTQEAYYNPDYIDSANNRLVLGIGNIEKKKAISSKDCEKYCFVKQKQLWYYDYQTAQITKVFGYATDPYTDVRDLNDQHDIKILNMDDNGNIEYLVYGYMNRGKYEGENGIALYRFNADTLINEQLVFFPLTVPYEKMEADIEKFAYLNEKNIFSFYIKGSLYRVDIDKGEVETIKENLIDNSLTASQNNSMIAIQENKNTTKNTKITIINLDTEKDFSISCKKNERIQSIGFVGQDFVYGIAGKENTRISKSGKLIFAKNQITIVDSSGEKIKQYSKSGRYITDAKTEGNVIRLTLAGKNGNSFSKISEEYIRYKEEEKDQVTQTYSYDTGCLNVLYAKFPLYVYVQTVPTLNFVKETANGEDTRIVIEEAKRQKNQYIVYVNGTMINIYNNLEEAIEIAEKERGLVVDGNGQTVWESNFETYAQAVGLNMIKVPSKKYSFAACVAMCAAFKGNNIGYEKIQEKQIGKLEQIQKYVSENALNLNGCNLDQILYYVSKEVPVIARIDENYYVLVMSYNSTKIRYMDPVLGEDVVVERAQFENIIKNNKKEFYGYID